MPTLQEVPPKYLQIAGHIRDQITRGDLQPGDEVPSERQLAQQWNVARPTASKALEVLRTQGLVEPRLGAGTFVREQRAAPRARERFDRARDAGTMYSPNESVTFLATDLAPAPDYVIDALSLSEKSQAVRRQRIIANEATGVAEFSTSWFHPSLATEAPRLLEPERIRGGTPAYISTITDRTPTYCRDKVTARLATAEERDVLNLRRPSAVLVYHLVVFDTHDEPIQFDEAVYRPGFWALSQEYPIAG